MARRREARGPERAAGTARAERAAGAGALIPRSLSRASARVVLACAAVAAAHLVPAAARAAERWEGLRALPRIAVEVTVSPNHPEVMPEELRRRVEDALHQARPAPAVDATGPDRLRLTVAVRAHSSSDLRGYYLPLSQTYGIGPVRLAVERPASIAGLAPVPAIVWQTERQAIGPWRASAAEILGLVDEVVAAFLADYRRAQVP